MVLTPRQYQLGDILFFTSLKGSFIDSIIQYWTASPFVHVAIAVSPTRMVEALGTNVQVSPITSRNVAAMWSYVAHAHPLDEQDVHDAYMWLMNQVGQTYGWADIINAALEKFENAVTLDGNNRFDCSGLATQFLLKAGGVAALSNVTDAHTVTPASLAKLLDVAPPASR